MSELDKIYEAYQNRNDKTREIEGRVYYRIVWSYYFETHYKEFTHRILSVVPCPEMPMDSNTVYRDENGNRFRLIGRPHIRFQEDIPRWYCMPGLYNVAWLDTKEIGEYLSPMEE